MDKIELKNGVFFYNREEDKYPSKDYIDDLEKYIESADELSQVLLDHGHLNAISNGTMWYGFNGLNVKLFLEEWRSKLAEIKKYRKETCSGYFEPIGMNIIISRVYADHRFTDKELNDLFSGKEITITFNTQWGNVRTVTGKIEKTVWDEDSKGNDVKLQFWGFVTHSIEDYEERFATGNYRGQQIKFKNSFKDHKYSQEEIDSLLNGDAIYISITNKNGKKVAVRLKLVQYQNDYYKAQPDFDVPPVFWAGHAFTMAEIETLHMGRTIQTNLISSKGNIYPAEIRWHDSRLQRKVKDGWK